MLIELIEPILKDTIFKLEFLDKITANKLKMIQVSENTDEISKLISDHRREERNLARFLNEKANINSEDKEDQQENEADIKNVNQKIKDIVKSIHQNLSEDKPDERNNIAKFKDKRARLVARFATLLDKMKNAKTNWISEFDKEIKEESDEFDRLKNLKAEEKHLNDLLKSQTREIKEKNAEKLRIKLDSEDKVRKERDKVNKLKAKQLMQKQAVSAEYDSVLDTTKKHQQKELERVNEELKQLESQETMQKQTQEFIDGRIKGQDSNETLKKLKEEYDTEKQETKNKIAEIEKKVAELTEEVELAMQRKQEQLNRIQADKAGQENQLRLKEHEAMIREVQKIAANEIRTYLTQYCNVAKKAKGKKK